MTVPFEVTFRKLRPSPWIDSDVRKRVAKLTTFFGDIQSGRVLVEMGAQVDGFGAIEAEDGRKVYFHANSVLGAGAMRLRVGSEVTFAEERGRKGPQASTVKVLARRA
jgi:cold shock CspA family protein